MYAIVKADNRETYESAVSHELAEHHSGDPLMVRFNDVQAAYVTASDAVRVEFSDYPDEVVGKNGRTTPGAEIIDVRS